MKHRLDHRFLLALMVIIALGVRLYGLNWDQSQHLHPDERFMTMAASTVSLPTSLTNYFSQHSSTLNPYNHNFNFYVYGTFPLLITRLAAETFQFTGYDQIFLIGRQLSAFFDAATVLVVYSLTFLIFKKKGDSILGSSILCYCGFLNTAISLFHR